MDKKLFRILQQRETSHGHKLPDTKSEISPSVSKVLKSERRQDKLKVKI